MFVTSVVAFALAGMLWGIFDTGMVQPIIDRASWSTGSDAALMAREYVRISWKWLPLIILFGLGVTNLIAARARTSSSSVILRTVAVFVVHFTLVMWALAFPELIDEIFGIFQNTPEMAEVGYAQAGNIAVDLGLGYGPALFAIGIDIWYILAPIRADFFGGVQR